MLMIERRTHSSISRTSNKANAAPLRQTGYGVAVEAIVESALVTWVGILLYEISSFAPTGNVTVGPHYVDTAADLTSPDRVTLTWASSWSAFCLSSSWVSSYTVFNDSITHAYHECSSR